MGGDVTNIINFKQAKADRTAKSLLKVVKIERAIDEYISEGIADFASLEEQLVEDFQKHFPEGDDVA